MSLTAPSNGNKTSADTSVDTEERCGPECDGTWHHSTDEKQMARIVACPARAAGASERPPSTPSMRRYNATRLDDVVEEPVRWLWPGRLPLGKVVVLDGDPSVGKSTLLLDIAARVTTGQAMPGEKSSPVSPAGVVLLAHEDGLGDTIRPRLTAAGADMKRVHHLDSVPIYDKEGQRVGTKPPMIPDDVDAIEELVADTGAVLVVVDVLTAHLSSWVNLYKDQDMRQALGPLADLAARRGVCVVLVRHPPKSQRGGGDAIAAGSGSIAIIGLARVGLLAAIDPDGTGERRILAVAKSNLGKQPTALAFQIVNDRGRTRIEWGGPTDHTANELLRQLDSEERNALDELRQWIPAVLSYAEGHAMANKELQSLALDQGWSRGQIYRARRRLQGDGTVVIATKTDVQGCPMTWRLETPPTS